MLFSLENLPRNENPKHKPHCTSCLNKKQFNSIGTNTIYKLETQDCRFEEEKSPDSQEHEKRANKALLEREDSEMENGEDFHYTHKTIKPFTEEIDINHNDNVSLRERFNQLSPFRATCSDPQNFERRLHFEQKVSDKNLCHKINHYTEHLHLRSNRMDPYRNGLISTHSRNHYYQNFLKQYESFPRLYEHSKHHRTGSHLFYPHDINVHEKFFADHYHKSSMVRSGEISFKEKLLEKHFCAKEESHQTNIQSKSPANSDHHISNYGQKVEEPPVFVLPNDFDISNEHGSPTQKFHCKEKMCDYPKHEFVKNSSEIHYQKINYGDILPKETEQKALNIEIENEDDETRKSPDSSTNNDSKFHCKICSSIFTSKSLLYKHLRGHTSDEKPFKCSECGQGFTLSSNLRQHRIIHRGYKPFQCEFCGKKFMRSNVYKQHRRSHTGEEMHKCSMCTSEFLQKYALIKHMKKNHNIDASDI